MIAADATMLTYAEAAVRCGSRAKTDKQRAKFIARRVANGAIKANELSSRFKRISELNLLKYLRNTETAEKTTRRK